MGKMYKKGEILEKCMKAIETPKKFYKEKFVNYTGKTKDTCDYYSEVVAGFLLDNINKFDDIATISRENYKVEGHDGKYDPDTNRYEEHIAMDLFRLSKEEKVSFDQIGTVLDYQVPLKDKQKDDAGKIDLLSKNNNTMYILELKVPESEETMLRCVLECYTYWKTVNHKKLIDSYGDKHIKYVKPAPLVYYKGYQWKEMQEDRPNLLELMKTLGIEGPYYYGMTEVKYQILQSLKKGKN